MKTKLVWSLAAFVMATIFPLCSAQASFLDDLTGYNSGHTQTYTYNVTYSGQPQNSVAVQYGATGSYTAAPVAQRQPVRQQVVAPQAVYQQPILQAQTTPQQRASSKAVTKKKANAARSVKAQPANRRPPAPAARSYQPNYGQTQQAGYYMNPYQTQYSASPNYYQGYYNNWSSSGQACPPGRA